MNHLILNIYGNKSYQVNVVRPEDLEKNIQYNKTFRPGRIMYLDGQRIYNGCIKETYLEEYDKIADEFFKDNTVNLNIPTIPYR